MSVFTNPARGAKAAADAYIRATLDLLGDRDPLVVLRETAARLRSRCKGVGDNALRRPEAAGKWSVLEVIQHLADSELVWAFRLRLVLAQDRPELTGYDQDAWCDALRYREVPPTLSLRQFDALRAANLWLLEDLGEHQLARAGVHRERGEERVEHMIRLYAGHDLVHMRQVERILTGMR